MGLKGPLTRQFTTSDFNVKLSLYSADKPSISNFFEEHKMDEVIMLLGEKAREILVYALDNNIPFDFCHMSCGKWQKGRAVLLHINSDRITLQIRPKRKMKETDIKEGRMVGISFQNKSSNGYDRFIFGSEVLSVVRSTDIFHEEIIELTYPEEIEVVRNKNFLKTDVPADLNIEVEITHRNIAYDRHSMADSEIPGPSKGKLINLSANELYVAIKEEQNTDFQKGKYVGIKFTPNSNETPICFNAYVRGLMQALTINDIGLEMEIVGLEASPEGRLILRRLCNIVNVYRKTVMTGKTNLQENFEVSSKPLYL